MNSHMPWFRVFPAVLLMEKVFRELSHELLGMWLRLLCLHWIDGGILTDAASLGRALGIRPTSAQKKFQCLEGFFVPFDDLEPESRDFIREKYPKILENSRAAFCQDLVKQMQTCVSKSYVNQQNGSLGGRPRTRGLQPVGESERFSSEYPSGHDKDKEEEPNIDDLVDYIFPLKDSPADATGVGFQGASRGGADQILGEPPSRELVVTPAPELEADLRSVISRYTETAMALGLIAPSEQDVMDLRPKLLELLSDPSLVSAFPSACDYMLLLGRSWWEKKQKGYSIHQLLTPEKIREFSAKFNKAQAKLDGPSRTNPKGESPKVEPPQLDQILGDLSPQFDQLMEIFGGKVSPVPDARLFRSIVEGGGVDPQTLVLSARALLQERDERRYLPTLNRWLTDGGYLVPTNEGALSAPPGFRNGAQDRRREVDQIAASQILAKSAARKKNSQDKEK